MIEIQISDNSSGLWSRVQDARVLLTFCCFLLHHLDWKKHQVVPLVSTDKLESNEEHSSLDQWNYRQKLRNQMNSQNIMHNFKSTISTHFVTFRWSSILRCWDTEWGRMCWNKCWDCPSLWEKTKPLGNILLLSQSKHLLPSALQTKQSVWRQQSENRSFLNMFSITISVLLFLLSNFNNSTGRIKQ